MRFRVVTLNLEQDHKRWNARQPLITAEIAAKPDLIAFNEVSMPLQTAKTLADAATEMRWPRLDRCIDYIWVSGNIGVVASEVCPDDPSLWPSDHAGVWADLRI